MWESRVVGPGDSRPGAAAAAVLFVAMAALPAAGAGPIVPVGPEFQVNSYTTSYQRYPAVAVADDGGFVVVWQSFGSFGSDPGTSHSVQAQRYDSAGTPLGAQFQVNTYTTGPQNYAEVEMDDQGGFVVVWMSGGSAGGDTSAESVQGQRYDSAGVPQGGEFQINDYTTNAQFTPAVAVNGAGEFVAVWVSQGSPGSDSSTFSVQGRRYDSTGIPLGAQFQVNTYTPWHQERPSVASSDDGFVVVWESWTENGSYNVPESIRGQRYDGAGSPVGGEFVVTSYPPPVAPSVAVEDDGDFVVAWRSAEYFHEDTWVRRYDSAGNPLGAAFWVDGGFFSPDAFLERAPSVDVDADGDFVVAWANHGWYGTTTAFQRIQGRRYDSAGSPLGSPFQISSYTTRTVLEPSVAMEGDGDFVVVWFSNGSSGNDSSGSSIQGRRFDEVDCADGNDNDGDGLVDAGEDPGCKDSWFPLEAPACQDGIDNDGQTGIDFDGGASANGGVPLAVADPQCIGVPWKNKEATPSCGLGMELVLLLAPVLALRCERRRARERRGEPRR